MTAVIKFKAEKKRLQGITSSLKIGHNYKMNRETECFVVENDTLTVFTFTFANVFWQSTSVTKEGPYTINYYNRTDRYISAHNVSIALYHGSSACLLLTSADDCCCIESMKTNHFSN